MSFNTLEGTPIEIDEFFLEQDSMDASALGKFALDPLMDVDLASVANDVSTPQGDAVATAAFNSHLSLAAAAFQSNLAKY